MLSEIFISTAATESYFLRLKIGGKSVREQEKVGPQKFDSQETRATQSNLKGIHVGQIGLSPVRCTSSTRCYCYPVHSANTHERMKTVITHRWQAIVTRRSRAAAFRGASYECVTSDAYPFLKALLFDADFFFKKHKQWNIICRAIRHLG